MEYAIETISLTKIFSDWWGRAKVYAVDDLNLQVKHNEVFGLLGPNGSGKTTTLKMLLGLLHPTRGRALLLGGDGADPKISARVGFLPEESYLYRFLNARETLDFYGQLFGLPANVRKTRIEALLDMVGLKAVASRPVGTYSKGMARRIGLAQALINDPDLLILDEPTTGLDPIGTRQIKDLILALARRGKTILLCSHLLADVEDVCDRIAILYGGRIQSHGRVADLLQQSNRRQIVTGAISEQAVERIGQIIRNEEADYEISSPMEKLETFFVRIVTEAQAQAKPTSGAVSTGKIGEFLTAQTPEQAILDKLVSAPTADATRAQEPVAEPVAPVDESQSEPDRALLDKLAIGGGSPVDRATPGTTEPIETLTPESDAVKRAVLDELVGGARSPDKETGLTQRPKPEEPSDA